MIEDRALWHGFAGDEAGAADDGAAGGIEGEDVACSRACSRASGAAALDHMLGEDADEAAIGDERVDEIERIGAHDEAGGGEAIDREILIEEIAHVRLIDDGPFLRDELGLGEALLALQRVIVAGVDIGVDVEHWFDADIVGQGHVGEVGEDGIELAVAQRLDEFLDKALGDGEGDIAAGGTGSHRAVDDMIGKHGGDADGELALDSAGDGLHFGAGAAGLVEHEAGIAVERFAGGRGDDAARLAFEQGGADEIFEILDAAGEGGLADEHLLGGAAETAAFDNGGEMAEMTEFHGAIYARGAWLVSKNRIAMHGCCGHYFGMNDSITPQALGIGQEIDGPGRVYFEQPVLDNLLETMMELAAEVWTIRDRQAVLETVLAEKGIDAAALIEAHVPDAGELAARKALREAFVGRLLAGFLRRPEGRREICDG